MKREELSFKMVVSPRMELDIIKIVKEMGFKIDHSRGSSDFIIFNNQTLFRATTIEFIDFDAPFLNFKEFCKLINSVEKPQPPFKFETFDKVLVRDSTVHNWMPRFFDEIHDEYFRDTNGHQWNMMMQYEGNESYKNSMKEPKQWWVMEDQKPRLIRK